MQVASRQGIETTWQRLMDSWTSESDPRNPRAPPQEALGVLPPPGGTARRSGGKRGTKRAPRQPPRATPQAARRAGQFHAGSSTALMRGTRSRATRTTDSQV